MGFNPVIVKVVDEELYYRLASWGIGDHKAGVFNEISERTAAGYFSGHADGLGWELDVPEEPFDYLQEIVEMAKARRSVYLRNAREELDKLQNKGESG